MTERWEHPELRLGVGSRPGTLRSEVRLKPAEYDAPNFAFDPEDGFRFEPMGAPPVQHANVAFVPRARPDLFARLRGVERA